MPRYKQRVDGEGFEVPSGTVYRIACCDCGLIHDFVFVSEDGKPIGVAARRNNRATAQRRKTASALTKCERLQSGADLLAADVERLREDAARYAWLKDGFRMMSPYADGEHAWIPRAAVLGDLRGSSLDAAIDAARSLPSHSQNSDKTNSP